jgi:hypothetical protein
LYFWQLPKVSNPESKNHPALQRPAQIIFAFEGSSDVRTDALTVVTTNVASDVTLVRQVAKGLENFSVGDLGAQSAKVGTVGFLRAEFESNNERLVSYSLLAQGDD